MIETEEQRKKRKTRELKRMRKDDLYMINHRASLKSEPEITFTCAPGFEFYQSFLEENIEEHYG